MENSKSNEIELSKHHIDGVWNTTEHYYKERKILIKSGKEKGIKAHAFYPNSDKVDFTLRFNFISPADLLNKMKSKIDKIQKATK